ncbi:hypothetical protein LG943_05825 [Streptomonospora sp. S1-112]|uniref:Uncharacterized protein n=1 Tax=Streptomonospora mangrovi TaxID=2883123 RepID=A0A9X3SDH8_9ACTN|nr:hypothetical protein [Streptomonospora mangrovi]MDA0563847.1 hypothetical protein [Streptomonospora mangrovi]
MTTARDDRYSITIGGNASGPVVAGNHNRVEAAERRDAAEAAASAEAGPAAPTPHSPHYRQRNEAADHGTVFAVTHGDMHVHQTLPAPAALAEPAAPAAEA